MCLSKPSSREISTNTENGMQITIWASPTVNSESGMPTKFRTTRRAIARMRKGITSGSMKKPVKAFAPNMRWRVNALAARTPKAVLSRQTGSATLMLLSMALRMLRCVSISSHQRSVKPLKGNAT